MFREQGTLKVNLSLLFHPLLFWIIQFFSNNNNLKKIQNEKVAYYYFLGKTTNDITKKEWHL